MYSSKNCFSVPPLETKNSRSATKQRDYTEEEHCSYSCEVVLLIPILYVKRSCSSICVMCHGKAWTIIQFRARKGWKSTMAGRKYSTVQFFHALTRTYRNYWLCNEGPANPLQFAVDKLQNQDETRLHKHQHGQQSEGRLFIQTVPFRPLETQICSISFV